MGNKTLITTILLGTFLISFLVATAVFDTFARARGFYQEGEIISRSWEDQ